MDHFEHFGEQQQSYEMLEEHRELLIREAVDVVSQHPGAEPVGIIMEAGAPEATEFVRMLEKQTGNAVPGFVGVMPRHLVLSILRANHPTVLDWFEDTDAGGPTRKLPLVALTKNGVRLGCAEYRVPM